MIAATLPHGSTRRDSPALGAASSPFDLDDDGAYRAWRAWKLAVRPRSVDDLLVDLTDPGAPDQAEREALLDRIARAGCAVYRSPVCDEDPALPRRLGAALGLHALDANWLADEDGISRIAVSDASDGHGGYIPYTDRAIGWHTDGYYHPAARRILGMVLHCVRPARAGGINALLDPELVYIALRDESPDLVRALERADAMTIPERRDDTGVARAAQAGPVFSRTADGHLHMRYTARTRSIEWSGSALVQDALTRLRLCMDAAAPNVHRLRLEAGMGIVGHNVLHDRSAFVDDTAAPRLLYRARFLDRVRAPAEDAWRSG